MYINGQGVAQDFAEGVKWYRKAAEQGNAGAQYNLGKMQRNVQHYAWAVGWYRKAAEQGHAKAQYNLGKMYKNGHGVPQHYAEAVKWYRKAAKQGNARAQNNLGLMYVGGLGVPQDYVQAHMWLDLAASIFSPGEDRDLAVKYRDIYAKKMTPAQISEAQRLAREWKPK